MRFLRFLALELGLRGVVFTLVGTLALVGLYLASIGASAPFIGLFGTVWGIMNSFNAIAVARETNLAVVAPHIAEALFATAMGLGAAIPAVIFYNKFAGDLDRFADRLENFSDEVAARLSRRLSERTA